MKILLCLPLIFLMCSCTHFSSNDRSSPESSLISGQPASKAQSLSISNKSNKGLNAPKPSLEGGEKNMVILEKMSKAIEAFVHKGEKKQFTKLCKDRRFDCYVGEKIFPVGKKKVLRKTQPYALGSKMGLQGEERIQARYEFYP